MEVVLVFDMERCAITKVLWWKNMIELERYYNHIFWYIRGRKGKVEFEPLTLDFIPSIIIIKLNFVVVVSIQQ